jgi:hypothetical protein
MTSKHLFLAILLAIAQKALPQCTVNAANIYSFAVSGITYEIVRENQTWVNAAACAVARGGRLAEIGSAAEQDTLNYRLTQAGITAANTVAPDGGGASYVWLGGTDRVTEGSWFWDGVNAASVLQFWQGTANGSAVNGLYTNWGNEPDNFNNQDALGLAITNWPLGVAGQWNDVKETNQLYYVIEYEAVATGIPENKTGSFTIYPLPALDQITIRSEKPLEGLAYSITDRLGRICLAGKFLSNNATVDLSNLPAGIYFIAIGHQENKVRKLIKN